MTFPAHTFPVMSKISHFMYNSKQGHMKFPVHFLRYQKFHVSCTSPRSRTYDIYYTFPVHILQHQKFYISCTFTRQGHMKFPAYFMCRVHFRCQGHVTFTVHFLNTYLKPTMKCYTLKIGYLYILQTLAI